MTDNELVLMRPHFVIPAPGITESWRLTSLSGKVWSCQLWVCILTQTYHLILKFNLYVQIALSCKHLGCVDWLLQEALH